MDEAEIEQAADALLQRYDLGEALRRLDVELARRASHDWWDCTATAGEEGANDNP
jgi:hypothetical protein